MQEASGRTQKDSPDTFPREISISVECEALEPERWNSMLRHLDSHQKAKSSKREVGNLSPY